MSKYGLSKEQIEESRRKYGDNTLTQPPRETFWSKLLGNFQDPIIRILIVALLVNAFSCILVTVIGLKQWVFSGNNFGNLCFYLVRIQQ